MEENKLFEYINPSDNDILSKMPKDELENLLNHLNTYYLSLRDSLKIDENITFGIELEFEKVNKIYEKYPEINLTLYEYGLYNKWQLKYDSSLIDGGELISPICTDNKEIWQEISSICEIIDKYGQILYNCSNHIHIGAHILEGELETFMNLLKLWSVYEKIIFRFGYGEYLTARSSIRYAKPVAENFKEDYELINKMNYNLYRAVMKSAHERNQAVNFKETYYFDRKEDKNTIEFRCPNGTNNPVIVQNNVNFFVKLLNYCKNPNFDNEKIQKRNEINGDKYNELKCYNEIYLEEALELADMLFDNNLDKMYFLRQYLKNFETASLRPKVVINPKAKSFTKKIA